MNRLILFVLLFAGFSSIQAQDTTWVQTFTWDSTSRVGNFDFPDDPSNSWQKIIMLYNMRCHDAAVGSGNVGCREWDYSCNTFIIDSTLVDSTRQTRLSHYVSDFDNQEGNVFSYSEDPIYSYYQFIQKDVTYTSTSNEKKSKVGADEGPQVFVNSGSSSFKKLYYFSESELSTSGLLFGQITGLVFNVTSGSGEARFLKIRMKATSKQNLDPANPELTGFTTVYFKNTDFPGPGEYHLKFFEEFDWNAVSNIVVEVSSTDADLTGNIELMSHAVQADKVIETNVQDNYLEFKGGGSISFDGSNLANISNAVTMAFWSYGNVDALPVNTSVFEGVDADNNRQVNVHLPWSNGIIYWDCGNDGSGYDRLEKQANPADFEGAWNHWAFTKDASTGEMKIYLNGNLWHTGAGRTRSIDLKNLMIGANINGGNGYQGFLDEFMIFNAALSAAEIQNIMHTDLASSQVSSNLVAYFPFNETTGNLIADPINNQNTARINGSVGHKKRYGDQLFTGFVNNISRPTFQFVQGIYQENIQDIEVLDSLQNTPNTVISYGVDGSDLITIDTQMVWDVYTSFVYNEEGDIIDFADITPDGDILFSTLTYFSKAPAKFEILSLVTPYGNGLDLGPNGVTFNIDVTDYAPILTGRKRMSLELGGQNQEEMDIRFMFVRGTPPREIKSIQNIWPFRRGSFAAIQNDDAFEPRMVPLNPDASMYKLRASITGHEQNGEFEIRNHYLNLDGGPKEFNFDVFKECSNIPIYPQGGTWIFDRAGWCPGDPTQVHQYDITDLVSGGQTEIDYGVNGFNMDQANYLVSAQLVSYGPINFANDAEITEIIRPTNQLEHARINPACNYPTVRIRNNGSENLRSLVIQYGEQGNPKLTHTWTGNLAFGETMDVELPLDFYSFWNESEDPGTFEAIISQPNGVTDEYTNNNMAVATFERPTVFDKPVVIEIKTNNRPTETSWRLKAMDGTILLERSGVDPNTTYSDELALGRGCYTLEIEDSADDGLYYWYWEQTGQSRGRGSARILQVYQNGIKIAKKSFEPEFGRFVSFDLAVPENLSSTLEPGKFELISLSPNPTSDFVKVDLAGFENQDFEMEIINASGQRMAERSISTLGIDHQEILPVYDFPAGIYFVKLTNGTQSWVKQFVKIER